MSVSDRKPRPLSRSLKAAAPGQIGRFVMRFLCSCFTSQIQ
jgi:hypothetical protein